MKIAILGAMEEEIAPFLNYFKISHCLERGNTTFHFCKENNIEIIIAYTNIGKINAAIVSTLLIAEFKVTHIFFSGVAGAIHPNLQIGDIIIATKLVQHDLDLTPCGHPYGSLPQSSIFIQTDKYLLKWAKYVALKQGIVLKEGIIATGDQFISNQERKIWISETFHADVLEMEGASIANVCKLFNIPCCIIRTISDTSDNNASLHYNDNMENMAEKSACFMIKIVKAFITSFY